jgi:hypothetical protein
VEAPFEGASFPSARRSVISFRRHGGRRRRIGRLSFAPRGFATLTRVSRRSTLLLAVLGLLLGAVAAGCGNAQPARASAATATLTVSATPTGPAVPAGFLGVSMEYKALEAYAGTNPGALDQPFLQLLRNLSPGGRGVLRIGGDSTDWSWWPMPHTAPPGGVRFALGPNWSAVARGVATAVGAKLMLGINFEADNRALAAYEAGQLLNHVGRSTVTALELGNEPELYPSFPWFKTAAGHHVYGRPRSYGPSTLVGDWGNIARGLPRGVTIAGPSAGSPRYLDALGSFEAGEPRLGMATVHAYPLKHCGKTHFDRPQDFFTRASLQGLAEMIGGWVATSRHHRLPLRVDEMNSISCGGQKGLSQALAPALWALDVLPRIVRTGAAGVNFHTVPGTNQALLAASRGRHGWTVSTEPEYLGLVAFAQAAPAGSRLLAVSARGAAGIDLWADRAPGGQVHVVAINPGAEARRARIEIAGATGAAEVGSLTGPGLGATSGATLDGLRIDPATGGLAGRSALTSLSPAGGGYAIEVPAHSASILAVN